MSESLPHRVIIVGGGFAGLNAVRALGRVPVAITLIDRRNFHLFQPLLYQVATGGLSPANIATPLRSIVERQKNCEVLLGNVRGFDATNRLVPIDGAQVPYDTLIVATGSRHSYFGHSEWEQFAPGLKTIEDATQIRRRMLTAFEIAERAADLEQRRQSLTIVIVGGGPTGVELAGTMAEIARHTLKREFRHIEPSDAQIILVEAGERVLPAFPSDLSQKAQASLERLGVVVRTKTMVADVTADHVLVNFGGAQEKIPTGTVFWAAGVEASPLGAALANATGAKLDRAGRIVVEPDLSLPGHPEILVLGDMASYTHQGEKLLPGVAPVAIQQGKFAAKLIAARLAGREPPQFHYHDLGNLATVGRSAAVAEFGKLHVSGFLAWLMWLFIHLLKLVGFGNRLLVLVQWGWNYFTYDRSARLITEPLAAEKHNN
ncbi:MAG TPA: NAD(P)/FAD-dependent oxidoreductase [Lacipirellulaceae bacterium]|jgi:NADH dehydrogenase|nr:NAD(P)/FAD-dependent oxidoreductase [Lacipirellulaceae bacterium]